MGFLSLLRPKVIPRTESQGTRPEQVAHVSTFKSRAFWQLVAGLVPVVLILWALLLPWLRRTFG